MARSRRGSSSSRRGTRRTSARRSSNPRGIQILWLLVGIAVVGTLGALVYNLFYGGVPEGEDQMAVCSLVIDRTQSIQPESVDAYRLMIEATIEGCRERRGELTVWYFDQGATALHPIGSYLLFQTRSRNPGAAGAALEDTLERAYEEVTSVLESEAPGGVRQSNILGAFKGAADDLRNQILSSEEPLDGFLVVLTDGLQLGPDVSVAAFQSETDRPGDLVNVASTVALIPDLSGINVAFGGVRTGVTDSGEGLPQWFESKVEHFWRGIVERGGGDLCVYQPAATGLTVDC